jgi:UDP-2,3-diacylglucosamine pyrophosphatase LpxH
MKNLFTYLLSLLLCSSFSVAQSQLTPAASTEMVFVSDTQQPMWIETLLLKPNHNTSATADIFAEILRRKPQNLFMLGDVVSLGYSKKKWKNVDRFLDTCRKAGTRVYGILGNHEILGRRKKGEINFAKRFPQSIRTGYVAIADSVAVILLNSNFNTLSLADLTKEKSWYEDVLNALDNTDSIRAVIVTCHHAPFSNSKIVGSSARVQQYFVPAYLQSKKAQLFITGHAHAFEHFVRQGKNFVVIGGGGGLHQPLNSAANRIEDLSTDYKPMFHYLAVQRLGDKLIATSYFLKENFIGFEAGHSFTTQ